MQRVPAAARSGWGATDAWLMAAPVKYTCSEINAAQAQLRSADSDLDQVAQLLEDDEIDADDAKKYVRYARREIVSVCNQDLETLRDANQSLREWGEELEEELDQLKSDHADLVREHEELTEDAEGAQEREEDLEQQLADLRKLLWAHQPLPPELEAALRAAGHGPLGEQLTLLLPPSTGPAHPNAAIDSAPPS